MLPLKKTTHLLKLLVRFFSNISINLIQFKHLNSKAPAPASVNLPPSQVSGNMTPAPITPAASSSAAPSNPKIENIPGHADLLKRQEELERKEAELERRERQMNVSQYFFSKYF